MLKTEHTFPCTLSRKVMCHLCKVYTLSDFVLIIYINFKFSLQNLLSDRIAYSFVKLLMKTKFGAFLMR